jgi:adenylate cyclase
MSEVVERKLAAILSADVVGYTRLLAEDEAATIRTLTDYREAIALLVRQNRGRIVDAPGDNVLAEFPTALDAVRCAIEIQRVLRARNADVPSERKMEFRIGIHMGDVRVEGPRIYGDGVNIAARLEALAEPGGVCISATVHEQVRNKLDVGYDDLGDQAVKNVPEHVHVYGVQIGSMPTDIPRQAAGGRSGLRRVGLVAGAIVTLLAVGLWATWPRARDLVLDRVGLAGPPVNPSLPEGPSLVVLPFANLSNDPEQEYFSDGITEDLTTDLSRSPFIFVISRNSAFSYKGKSVKIEEIGRELGVRYVLEGSVRKAGDQVRITAQLIDAANGFHVWSQRYDRQLADIFTLQSEISQEILGAVGVEINQAELERIRRKPTEDLTAYDALMRGLSLFNRFSRKDNTEARRLLEQAIELDPSYPEAHALLAATYSVEYGFGWNLDPKLMDRAEEGVQKALSLNPSIPGPHTGLAAIHLFRENPAGAVASSRRAIELAPNFDAPYFFLAMGLAQQGKIVQALQAINRAQRLNPRAPSGYSTIVPYVNLAAGRKEKALELFEGVRAANPELINVRIPLAALYESDGRHAEALAIVQEILRVNPNMTAEQATGGTPGTLLAAQVADLAGTLRAAGLP